jgi:acetolactate synthase small subunit
VDDIAKDPPSRANSRSSKSPPPRNRSQIFDLVEVFRARIVDLTSSR